MKLNHLLLAAFVLCSVFVNAQFKRSFNHYYHNSKIYQSYALEQPNESIDLVRVELSDTGHIKINTSNIDKIGELTSVSEYTFAMPAYTSISPIIAGVIDNGLDRIILTKFCTNTTMTLYVVKYNRSTGVESANFLLPITFKPALVNSIQNGNEMVDYCVKSTGGLYRIAFDLTTISNYTEELVDASVSTLGSGTNLNFGKDGGKIILFNGNEVSSFASGTKQVYERTASNTYVVHALNANSTGIVNLINLPNGNLFVANNGDLFELNNSFSIVNSALQESSFGGNASEFGLLNNQLHQFFTKNGPQTIYHLTYDLSLNMIDSTIYNSHRLIDLIPANNGLALIGHSMEGQIHTLYVDDATNFNSNPIIIDYFTNQPNPTSPQEYHESHVVNNLFVDLGLGNQIFPQTTNGTNGMNYNDSLGLVYNMANVYAGLSNTDTLGTNGTFYQPEYLPGPYTTSGMYSDLVADRYNRGFFVSRQMIEDHIDSLQSGSATYLAPHGIRNWPAHGNVSLGQVADLAPFVDVNSNGQYEPYLGDYPSIYGDYCSFSITHDNPNTPKSASVETHSYKYWFDCDSTQEFENTIFVKTLYFSRVHDFEQFRLGTQSDIDLGNYADDYVGTHAELGLIYQYNADLFDDPNAGRPGFNDKCPAAGFMILKGSKLANDTLDNPDGLSQNGSVNGYGFADSWIDNEYLGLESSFVFSGSGSAPGQSDPSDVYQLANYLNGQWQFGDALYYGETGFSSNSSNIPAKFMYTGTSDTVHYGTFGAVPDYAPWSEVEPIGTGSTSNPGGDRRMIGSTGAQRLYVGDTVVYDIVYVMSDDTTVVTSIDQSQNSIFAKALAIKTAFNSANGPCGIDFTPIDEDLAIAEQKMNDVLIYPNPTKGTFKIDGLLNPNASISIFDMEGRLLIEQQNVSTQTELSLEEFEGNMFIVSIRDGAFSCVKRVVKN